MSKRNRDNQIFGSFLIGEKTTDLSKEFKIPTGRTTYIIREKARKLISTLRYDTPKEFYYGEIIVKSPNASTPQELFNEIMREEYAGCTRLSHQGYTSGGIEDIRRELEFYSFLLN